MPQGPNRSKTEQREFSFMLPNINLLYLGASCLLLVDISYVSRFWTQFEAWLSMQHASIDGLTGAMRGGSSATSGLRCTIVTLHNAPKHFEQTLLDMWGSRTASEGTISASNR